MFFLQNAIGIIGILGIDYVLYRSMIRNLIFQYRHARKLVRSGVHLKGRITGFENKEDLDHHPQFAPIVQFFDEKGNSHLVTPDDYHYTKPKVGVIVDVYFEKENPADFVIDFGSLLIFKFFLVFISSVIGLIVSVGMLYHIYRS
jgi:hypothetical protein